VPGIKIFGVYNSTVTTRWRVLFHVRSHHCPHGCWRFWVHKVLGVVLACCFLERRSHVRLNLCISLGGVHPSFVSHTIVDNIGHVTRTPTYESIATNRESDWLCFNLRHCRRSGGTADSVLIKSQHLAGCGYRHTVLLEMHQYWPAMPERIGCHDFVLICIGGAQNNCQSDREEPVPRHGIREVTRT
jgi:hypothetical protein